MKDISFDLETLGTDPAAMILSIGAVRFDRNSGEISPDYFYRVIDLEAPGGGGVINASTVVWWMNQNPTARDAIFSKDPAKAVERTPLRVALSEFADWLGTDVGDLTLWQRGDKDSQWLVSAFEGTALQTPYNYWQVKDQRTLCDLFKPFWPKRDDQQTPHNALGDAYYQAHCLVNTFKRLNASGALLPGGATSAPDVGSMVDRFLGWRLPDDFAPDCGVAFTPLTYPNSWPVGTNLFTAVQAKAMFEHALAEPATVVDHDATPADDVAALSE